MAEFRISLQERYADAFGIVINNLAPRVARIGFGLGGTIYPPILDLPASPRENRDFDLETYSDINPIHPNEPILDFLKFKVINDEDPDNPEALEYVTEIPAAIRFNRTKIMNETVLNRDFVEGIEPGIVVESSGWAPWDITVQGLLINQDNHLAAPKDQLATFQNFLRYHKIYDVICDTTNAINVGQVTVREISFNQMANFLDTISFTLNLRSHVSPAGLIISS